MRAGSAVYDILSHDPDVTAITQGIFPNIAPTELALYPLIVYEGEDAWLDSTLAGTTNLGWEEIKVHCIGLKKSDAGKLAGAARDALMNKKGSLGGLTVLRVGLKREPESQEPLPGLGQDKIAYIKTIEIKVWFRIPTGS